MREIGTYRVVRSLADTGRDVYLARNAEGELVVLARVQVNPKDAREVEADAARCGALVHPNIARAVEIFPWEGGQVVVYEATPGASLGSLQEHLCRQRERLSDGAALHIGLEMLRGLAAAHVAKNADGATSPLIHTRLEPHQVFLSWDGGVVVLGLGLLHIFRVAAGSEQAPPDRRYAAPEVNSGGALTVRANVYSAAAMLWSLLVGEEPPLKGPMRPLKEARPDLSRPLAILVDKALEPSLVRRTISCAQLAMAIEKSALAVPQDLFWNLEIFKALGDFAGSTIGVASMPPASLSDVPPSSVPSVISFPPESDDLIPTAVQTLADTPQIRAVRAELARASVAQPPPRTGGSRTNTAPSMRAVISDDDIAALRAARVSGPEVRVEEAPEARPVVATVTPRDSAVQLRRPPPARAPALDPETSPRVDTPNLDALPSAPVDAEPGEPPVVSSVEPITVPTPATTQAATEPHAPAAAEQAPAPAGMARAPQAARSGAHAAVAAASKVVSWWEAADAWLTPRVGKRWWAVALIGLVCFWLGWFARQLVGFDEVPEQDPPRKPRARATAGPSSRSSATASASSPAVEAPAPGHTFLYIDTSLQNAHLYISGKYVGPVQSRNEVRCGIRNVRLGDYPLTQWLSKGASHDLPCGGSLRLRLD